MRPASRMKISRCRKSPISRLFGSCYHNSQVTTYVNQDSFTHENIQINQRMAMFYAWYTTHSAQN